MATSVTLRQEKTILTGDIYRVVSVITVATPDGMYPLFVVSEGTSVTDEQYERVATLEDLAALLENPLVRLTAASAGEFSAIGTIVGDKLLITNAPEAWYDTYFVAPPKFVVAAVDPSGNWIEVQSTKPFPTALDDLNWTVKDSTEVTTRGSGTGAKSQRHDDSDTTWLRRHWTSLLTDVAKAEARLISIETGVDTIVKDAKTYGVRFTGVVTTVYS